MASVAAPVRRRTLEDYPDHLNPFSDHYNDNRNKFWTIGRRSFRSNSFSVQSFKDFRNTWSFKSFTKKGRRELQNSQTTKAKPEETVTFRRQTILSASTNPSINRSVNGTGENNRYVYGGSVTPLPRFRSWRVENKTPSQPERPSNSLNTSSTYNGSMISTNDSLRGSIQSFQSECGLGENRNTPIRASARKKRRAPPPPPRANHSVTTSTEIIVLNKTETDNGNGELESDTSYLNIELKIVEEDEVPNATVPPSPQKDTDELKNSNTNEIEYRKNLENNNEPKPDEDIIIGEDEDDLDIGGFIVRKDSLRKSIGDMKYVMAKLKSEESKTKDENLFPKVDIATYKRHLSIDEEAQNNGENVDNNNIQAVKCKLVDSVPPEKHKVNGHLKENSEPDGVKIKSNGTSNLNGKVSPDCINQPNPIPKPRRTKLLKSTSSEESSTSERSSTSPYRENLI